MFNAALSFRLKWEGDLRTLEGQIEETLGKSQTMGSSVEEALHKLRADPDVGHQFREAYGREADGEGLVGAIAAYERSLLTPGSRFDRWLGGDANAITARSSAGTSCSSRLAASLAIKGSTAATRSALIQSPAGDGCADFLVERRGFEPLTSAV